MTETKPICPGEMTANEAVKFFDNICDEQGKKLVKVAKRSKLRELMVQLFINKSKNKCKLASGKYVPIIVYRKNPHRGGACYFNNIDAPQKEIMQAFAEIYSITYKAEEIEQKQTGDIIAQEILQFLDKIYFNNKKIKGRKKLPKIHELMAELYKHPESNIYTSSSGNIPIIVKRKGKNNHVAYYFNTSDDTIQIIEAFAKWAGCQYLSEKKKVKELPEKKPEELTARQCARIFHNVSNVDENNPQRDASPRLVKWFEYIGNSPQLNQVQLPNGKKEALVIYRRSHSQPCWCLNSSDETIKPFIIKKIADIIGAEIEFKNISLKSHKPKELYQTMLFLTQEAQKSTNYKERNFYMQYAEMIYIDLGINPDLSLSKWVSQRKSR